MSSCPNSFLPCVDAERIRWEKCFSAVVRLTSKPDNIPINFKSKPHHDLWFIRRKPELSSVNPLMGSQVARRAVLPRAPRPHACVPLSQLFLSEFLLFLLIEYFYLGTFYIVLPLCRFQLCHLFVVCPVQHNFNWLSAWIRFTVPLNFQVLSQESSEGLWAFMRFLDSSRQNLKMSFELQAKLKMPFFALHLFSSLGKQSFKEYRNIFTKRWPLPPVLYLWNPYSVFATVVYYLWKRYMKLGWPPCPVCEIVS